MQLDSLFPRSAMLSKSKHCCHNVNILSQHVLSARQMASALQPSQGEEVCSICLAKLCSTIQAMMTMSAMPPPTAYATCFGSSCKCASYSVVTRIELHPQPG